MRISDWSSDVCSSDLPGRAADGGRQRRWRGLGDEGRRVLLPALSLPVGAAADIDRRLLQLHAPIFEHRLKARRGVADQRLGGGRLHREVHLRSEEHTSELQSLMRISYAVFCLKKKT